MKNDYISVIYDSKRTPRTEYPAQLVSYLIDRFGLKEGNKLLEIGCGRGDFLHEFKNSKLVCSGIDREKCGDENISGIDVRICDIEHERLPFENETFDIVYHKSLIEHLYYPKSLMEETRRVLKKDGKVIILTPDWVSQIKTFYEDFTHSRPYTVTALKDLLKVSGFENIEVEKFYQLPILWKFPFLKAFSKLLGVFLSTETSRALTKATGIKYFRWSVELMILGAASK